MRETQPEVYLFSEPKVRWDEVERYLDSVGGLPWLDRVRPARLSLPGEPKPKPVATDAELLVEIAGRSCYRSWAPGLNANVTKVREDSGEYLDNILRSKHGAVLEHAQFTFMFENVSRVFTHELVRHRAGVAISQESLRYVRLTDLGFRVPEILADGPDLTDASGMVLPMNEAVISIVERLEEFQRDAAEAFGLDDDDVPFHYKKEVTSALRRLAPIGLSTSIMWSANIRTLRHVIAQRTAAGAEEEIRLVFSWVASQMKAEYPLLFGDFEAVGGSSGTPEWVPSYEKV